MSNPHSHRSSGSAASFVRVNGKIRAREVRVIGDDNKQLGVFPLAEAIQMARARGVDLVEISANANPPVCRIVDLGKWRYEQSKKEKEATKAHANKVKEVQLSATIDPHDFGVKKRHAIDFLCDDMKVKVSLRFRGREMAHQEIGFEQVNKFLEDIRPWGHADFAPKLAGRNINVMISPLPRNKRARHPKELEGEGANPAPVPAGDVRLSNPDGASRETSTAASTSPRQAANPGSQNNPANFANNPFSGINFGT